MKSRFSTALMAGLVLVATGCGMAQSQNNRYQHVFIIIEENRSFQDIIDNPVAPKLTQLARQYGLATRYYAVTHPSQPNYIALLGGSTFGIADDDAFYCYAGTPEKECFNSKKPGYPAHSVAGRSLMDQLRERGLTWKGY